MQSAKVLVRLAPVRATMHTPRPLVEIEHHGSFLGHTDCVYTLEAGPERGFFFSAGADGIVARWDAQHPEADGLALFRAPSPVYALKYIPEYELLVAGLNDGTLHVFGLQANQLVRSIRVHTQAVFDLAVVPGRPELLAAGRDGLLTVWSLPDFEQRATLRPAVPGVGFRTMAFSPDAQTLVLGGTDGLLYYLDANTLQVCNQQAAHQGSVFRVVFSHTGEWLFSTGRDAHLRQWAMQPAPTAKQDIVAHLFALNDARLSANGQHLATASMDKSIRIWDTDSLRLLKVIDRPRWPSFHTTGVNRLLWLPDSIPATGTSLLLSASDDRRVLGWKLRIG
jgi:WD40 repeat protein